MLCLYKLLPIFLQYKQFAYRFLGGTLGLLIHSITQKKKFLFSDPISFIGVIVAMHRKTEKMNKQ